MRTDPEGFDLIAREVFAPLYPVVAHQILCGTGVRRGRCLDVGTGPGLLGLALAQLTDLEVCLLDRDPEMLRLARRNVAASPLETSTRTVEGDVHALPFPEDTFHLAVSRGSLFFWDDPEKAFGEILRVLAPGGFAWIGGGFGTGELKQKIAGAMRLRDPQWRPMVEKHTSQDLRERFLRALDGAGILHREVQNDDEGFWIRFRKGEGA